MNLPKELQNKLLMNESMRKHTSIGIGGRALYFIPVNSVDELRTAVDHCRDGDMDFVIVGGGTNVLASDTGIDSMVIKPEGGCFNELVIKGNRISAGAGCSMARLVNEAVEKGLQGLEGLAGVPGTVGGALRMNAGGKHGFISDCVEEITVLSRECTIETRTRNKVDFSCRSSSFQEGEVIIAAAFHLSSGSAAVLEEKKQYVLSEKRATQPLGEKSCGCVFKNPENGSAGELIDRCGLKGERLADIQVSSKHANFLVNKGRGSSRDMIVLMERIYHRVLSESGIALQPEIVFFGECGWKY